MKKTLLLCALLAATAANTYAGRRWDFTKWSDATIANIKADATQWSDIEKATGTAPTDLSKENCYWQVSTSGSTVSGTLTANGVAIAELEGLNFVNTTDRSLAIALNYQGPLSDGFGPYEGPSYLWLGSSKKSYFKIPNVEPGTEITIGVESHKSADARGVELYVNSTSGTKLLAPNGDAVSVPTTYEVQTWLVPEELSDNANEDGTYDILVYNTNGCHLYYIQVGDNSEKTADELRVAYIYDPTYSSYGESKMGGIDNDPIFQNVISGYAGEAIDVANAATEGLSTEALNDSLLNFDVVVLGEGIASGNTYAKALVDIVNMVPILNLKSFMYKSGVWSWGAGKNPSPAANAITVNEAFREDALFEGVNIDDEGLVTLFEISNEDITAGNLVQGYTATAGSLIADDEVIATVSGVNAIHRHGTRNSYLLIPISSDNIYDAADGNLLSEDAFTLLNNAITTLAETKSKVQNANAPVISQDNQDNITTVTLSCATADAVIYYTLDGSEPTTASTVYTEPFDITENGTVVSAFATAQGYLESKVATATIVVKSKLATPTITVNGANVTIAGEGTIYYNINGNTNTAKSQVYSEPFDAPFSCTITAFAAADDKLTSESVTADVVVASDIYTKQLEHVSFAGSEGWGSYSKSTRLVAAYNALATEATDSTLVTVADSSYYEYTYAPTDSVYTLKAETVDWTLTTKGQMLYYITDYNDALSVEGGSTAYGYASVFDNKDYTRYGIGFYNIKHVREEGVANAYLTSGKKYQAPFEVALTFTQAVGSGTNQALNVIEPGQSDVYLIARFEVAVSTDGENWNVVDTISAGANKMAVRRTTVYDGNDAVQIRVRSIRPLNLESSSNQKAVLFDIVINGEGDATAIETIGADKVANEAANAPIFDLLGRRVNKLENGKFYLQGGKKFIVR
jgi:hypothetical protein